MVTAAGSGSTVKSMRIPIAGLLRSLSWLKMNTSISKHMVWFSPAGDQYGPAVIIPTASAGTHLEEKYSSHHPPVRLVSDFNEIDHPRSASVIQVFLLCHNFVILKKIFSRRKNMIYDLDLVAQANLPYLYNSKVATVDLRIKDASARSLMIYDN